MTSNRRQGRRDPDPRGKPRVATDDLRRPLLVALTALVAIELVAGLLPASNWRWGLNLLRYYPAGLAFGWAAVALLGIWWPLRPLALPTGGGPRIALTPPVAGLFAGIAAVLILHALRSQSHLLGDGYEVIRRLRQGTTPAPRAVLFNALAPGLFRLMGGVGTDGGAAAAGWFAVLAGSVATVAVVAVALRLAQRGSLAGPAGLSLLLATPVLQIFSGYIESYSPCHAGAIVFFAFAFDRQSGGGAVALAGATAGCAIALVSHPFGLTLAPAWLFLLASPADAEERRASPPGLTGARFVRGAAALLGVTLLATLVFAFWPALRASNSPWRYAAPQELLELAWKLFHNAFGTRPWATRYTVLSWVHLSDVVNTAWIVGAPGIAVLAALVARPAGRKALRSPPARLALLAFVGIFIARVFVRTPLGAARDWDVYAGFGLGLNAIAAGGLLGLNRAGYVRPLIVAGLFVALPFVGIQMSPERSARRHFEAIEAEPRPEPFIEAGYHGVMGDRFGDLGQYALASRAYARALSAWPRKEYAWRLGTVEMAQKHYDLAAQALERAIRIDPNHREATVELGNALNGLGQFARADSVLAQAIIRFPEANGLAMVYRARARYLMGDMTGGQEWLAAADRALPAQDPGRTDLKRLRDEVGDAVRAGALPSPAAVDPGDTPPSPR